MSRKIITFWALLTIFFAFSQFGVSAKTYQLKQDFEGYTVGEFSEQNNGDFVIEESGNVSYEIVEDDNSNNSIALNVLNANTDVASIRKNNLTLAEDFMIKQRVHVSDSSRRTIFRLFDLDGSLLTVLIQNGKIYAVNDTENVEVQSVNALFDIDLKMIVDYSESTYDLYVDGYLVADNYKLSRKLSGEITSIELCEVANYSKSQTLIDNLHIWTYADYVKYIDNGKDVLYVTPTGNDMNSGVRIQTPLATVKAAKQKILEMNEHGIERSYTVYIQGGEYEGLRFNQYDVPPGNNTVTYMPYDENSVVKLSNAVKAKNWQSHSTNIYKTFIGYNTNIRVVYVGDSRATLARYPNTGYNTAIETSTPSATEFYFNSGDIPTISNTTNVEAHVWPGGPDGYWAWVSDIREISNIDYTNKKITVDSGCSYVVGTGSRYYLQNAMEFLDTNNEFYYNDIDGYLYYYTDSDISSLDIRYDVKGSAVTFDNASNIILDGLNLSKTQRFQDAVRISNSNNITIKNCKVMQSGGNGISSTDSKNIKILNNEITDIGTTAVLIRGSKGSSSNHTVENNHVHDTGRVQEHGTGIQISESGNNLITKNRIHNTPRYGVSIKGIVYSNIAGTTINGKVVTLDNYEDFVYAKNNTISYNDIYDVNKNSQDNGLIELYGAVQNNIINNKLHDSSIPFSVGYGVYLDDSASHNNVENNLIYNLSTDDAEGILEYVIFTKGIGNVIKNNVLANNNAIAAIGSSQHTPANPHRDLEIANNIIYNSGDNLYYFTNWSSDRLKECDYNLFYNDSGEYTLAGNGAQASTLDEWKTVLNNKFDQNSVVADPLFVDADNNDYRIYSTSPAFGLGFEAFECCSKVRTGMYYELNDYQISKENNKIIAKAEVIKRDGTSQDKSKVSVSIVDANNETLFRGSVSKIIENNVPFAIKTVADINGLAEDCILKITADNDVLYTISLSEIN